MFVKKASVFFKFFCIFWSWTRTSGTSFSWILVEFVGFVASPVCLRSGQVVWGKRERAPPPPPPPQSLKQATRQKQKPARAGVSWRERERERERSTYCIPLYRQSAGAENSSSTDREAGILYEYCGIHIRIMGSLLRALRFLLLLLLVLLRLRFLRGLFFPLLPWPPDLSRGRRRLQGVSPCRHRRSFKSPDEFYANSVFFSLSIDLYLKDNLISGEGRNFERRNIELPIFRNLKIANV